MNTAPLQGIKVVDFTEVQSGPSCTQMLAWLGAEVIKIERPGVGDATRNELQFDPEEPSYYFLQLNSDKKSLALDAKTPDGKEILTKLVQQADIFVENLHPGAMDKLGFSWEEVHKLNPKCIYAAIKGFPLSSRYKDLKAYEPIAQVTAGAATTTGWYEGEYNIPTQSGAALADVCSSDLRLQHRHAHPYRYPRCPAAASAYGRRMLRLSVDAQRLPESL